MLAAASTLIERPPRDPVELATWFLEATDDEITFLARQGARRYELATGDRVAERGGESIYDFTLLDDVQLREDSSGTVDVAGVTYTATVYRQVESSVTLGIQAADLPQQLSRVLLTIDEAAILRQMVKALEESKTRPSSASMFSTLIFHPENISSRASLAITHDFARLEPEQRDTARHALENDVTYVWVPPGT